SNTRTRSSRSRPGLGPSRDRVPWEAGGRLLDEEVLELRRGVVESRPPEAVVGQAAPLGQGHETRRPELGEVVLDRRLRQLERLCDLGEVQVAIAEQAQDPQARVVPERSIEADEGLRRRHRIDRVERAVSNRVAEQAPVVATEQ